MNETTIDALAIGAHPDDAEFGAGGTLLKLRSLGYTTGILDMSRGEMGTRGTPEERAIEALDAAKVLGLSFRASLDLGDGRIRDTDESRAALVAVFRRLRPRIVFTHHFEESHPDHIATANLVRACVYMSGLAKYSSDSGDARHRPCAVAHYSFPRWLAPSFVVDISDWIETKVEASKCHRTQLFDPNSEALETALSGKDFLDKLNARARYFGSLIGSEYAEGFYVRETIAADDPIRLFPQPINIFY